MNLTARAFKRCCGKMAFPSVGQRSPSADPACDLMILAAPKTDYLPDEIAKIQAFMNDGGG